MANPGCSIALYESLAQRSFSVSAQDKVRFELYAWKDGGEAELIGFHPIDSRGWFELARRRQQGLKAEIVGIGSRLIEWQGYSWTNRGYFPTVTFDSDPFKHGSDTDAFFAQLAGYKQFQGKKFYVFECPEGPFGFLDTIIDGDTHALWMNFLERTPFVNQEWVASSSIYGGPGGLLRATPALGFPYPTLKRWVLL